MRRVYQSVGDHWQRHHWYHADGGSRTLTIIEQGDGPRFSGLLDANGNKLMVSNERDPIGFVHFPRREG